MGHKNSFQRVSLMITSISLSGVMNMTAASGPNRWRASDTLSRSLGHPSQHPLQRARLWISMYLVSASASHGANGLVQDMLHF